MEHSAIVSDSTPALYMYFHHRNCTTTLTRTSRRSVTRGHCMDCKFALCKKQTSLAEGLIGVQVGRNDKKLNPARIERTTLRISQLESHALPLCQGFMFIQIIAQYIKFMLC